MDWLQASERRTKSLDIHHELMMPPLRDKESSEHSTQNTKILFQGRLSANGKQSSNRNGPASEQHTPDLQNLLRRSWHKHADVGWPCLWKRLSEF